MNELEKIKSLKVEINKIHDQIKQSMFLLVQMLGEEVISPTGRSYKASENTGVSCLVEAFVIEEATLKVKTNFDGDRFTLELDSFHAEELADILYLMLEESKERFYNKTDKLFSEYVEKHQKEPLYASCCIKYLDDSGYCDVTIKLNNELDVQDDLIHYYCNGPHNIKSMCEPGVEDFIVTDVYEFLDKI